MSPALHPSAEKPIPAWLRPTILAALTALMVYLCWRMATPFVSAFTWALALAIASQPLRNRLTARMPATLAALLTIVVLIIGLGIPAALLSHQVLHESIRGQEALRQIIRQDVLEKSLRSYPWIRAAWDWLTPQMDLPAAAQQAATSVGGWVAPLFAGSFRIVSQLATSIFVLFFFLRDQEPILKTLRGLLPLKPTDIDHVLSSVKSAIYAAVYGRLAIGLLQGLLGGLIFWFVGLPAPVFWGCLMALLSILPVVGTFIVLAPAAAVLLLTGAWGQAIAVTLWGLLVIHPVDNVLYPMLVGEKLGLHPLVLFVAFVGGLITFGPPGLILGPAIVAAAIALVAVWKDAIPVPKQEQTHPAVANPEGALIR